VVAGFEDGSKVEIYLGPDRAIYAVLRDSDDKILRSKERARSLSLPKLSVLPQVMPLNREEFILHSADYVRANVSSHLSPLHFRNQLRLFYDEYFNYFKALIETSWPGLQIRELQIVELEDRSGLPRKALRLLVRDGDFVAEVACMGHGLQMWLQTMWFLTRTAANTTIVLDEPDVYMHPDLQKRLLRFIRGRYAQCVIATHSTEILAEADTSNILIVDRHQKASNFTTTLPAVQRVLEHIGSAQNLQLMRLWNAKKLLLVEGKDLKILRRSQDLIFPTTEQPFDTLPHMSIEGWTGWPYAVGSAMLLRNRVGEEIMTYCVLDSDYHTEEERKGRRADAADKGVHLHIWFGKEIENYLVVPTVIARLIARKAKLPQEMLVAEVEAAIEKITKSLKDSTIDAISHEIHNRDRSKGVPNANRQARAKVKEAWTTPKSRVLIVSGKQLLSDLSRWGQDKFKVSFGVVSIAKELRRDELHQEVVDIITAIENSAPMPY
jgi:hypothetical protein